jgi:hypothetical protein
MYVKWVKMMANMEDGAGRTMFIVVGCGVSTVT